MEKILIIVLILLCLSCNNQYDGMVLHDENGNKYLIKHNIGASYFIDKEVEMIIDGDTVNVFK